MKAAEARAKCREKIANISNGSMVFCVSTLLMLLIQQILIPHYKNFTKNSKSAISIVNVYLIPFFGHLTVQQVTYAVVQASVYKLMGDGFAAETIRKRVQSGHLFFELLIRNGLATTNPFKGVNRPQVNNIRDYVLTSEQRLPYIECLRAENSVFSDALLLQLFLALRVSEVISIKVENISKDLTLLKLEDTKSNKNEYVPINSFAKEVMQRRISLTWNEYLCPSPKKLDQHISSPRGCFERVKKRMATKGFDISGMWQHDNRRSSCTVSSEVSGGNSHLIAGFIRHSNTHILNRYIHHSNTDVAALSEATALALLTPIKSNPNEEM